MEAWVGGGDPLEEEEVGPGDGDSRKTVSQSFLVMEFKIIKIFMTNPPTHVTAFFSSFKD